MKFKYHPLKMPFHLEHFFLLIALVLPQLQAEEIRTYKIGLAVWTGYDSSVQGFKEALASDGLKEGKNVQYILAPSHGNKIKQKEIAKQFKKEQVDLVYSLTTTGTTIIKENISKTTPIVFSIVTYPDDSGLIESFEYSANNLVGTSNYVDFKYYVELLNKILPETKTIAIFHRNKEPNSQIQASNMIRLLKKKNIKVIDLRPNNLEELKRMASSNLDKVDAFMTTTDTLMQGGGEEILIDISLKHHIPILSSNKKGIEKGSTFGPVADFYTLGKMSGKMASSILLKGTRPAHLESKTQDPPLYLINRTSFKKLKLKLNDSLKSKVKFID